jgi:hypothetical protein
MAIAPPETAVPIPVSASRAKADQDDGDRKGAVVNPDKLPVRILPSGVDVWHRLREHFARR